MRVAVLGCGSWGTALAAHLGDAGHDILLWGRDAAVVAELHTTRQNRRYLPDRVLRPEIVVTEDFSLAVSSRELIVLAVPSASLRGVCLQLAPIFPSSALIVCAAKGLDEISCATMDRVVADVLPGVPIALLSGPTFAIEVAKGLPAAVVVASTDGAAAAAVQHAFATDRLRVYTTEDVVGVALGGALKNVMAIAAGCSDGLGFGHNARAALITRGLHEMGRLAARMGGNPLTLSGLAGLGDLVLTCTSDLSRNRKVGLALALGTPLATITARIGQVAEGVLTARTAERLATLRGVDMPITAQVAAVIDGRRSAREAVADLLSRESRPERG